MLSKTMSAPLPTTGNEKIKAMRIKEQIDIQKGVREKLDETNNNINQNTKMQQQVVQNIQNNKIVKEREIPDQTESAAVVFHNGAWGY